MIMEPELITIVEGQMPDFRATSFMLTMSVLEGPMDAAVAMCELRTMKGESIMARCREAWREGRPVKLDFPVDFQEREQIEVVAMRLDEVPEGQLLQLWVRHLIDAEDEIEEELDEGDDDYGY
jgi:hypothetical protein